MVNDSIVEKFNGSAVTVAGVDIWNSSDSLIGAYIAQSGVNFPIAKKGSSVATSYGVIANSMVVIDRNGTVQYVKQLGTASTSWSVMAGMVSAAASKVRSLLISGVRVPAITGRVENRIGTDNRRYSLSGRVISGNRGSASVVAGSLHREGYTECTLFK
jgi:hypothetical protein